jgi:hypothetical protein
MTLKICQRRIRLLEIQNTYSDTKRPLNKLSGPPSLSATMPSGDFYIHTQDRCLSKYSQFFTCILLFYYFVTSVELPDVSKPTVTSRRRFKSVGTEASIAFLSAHTDYDPSSTSSLSFEEEARLLRIAMPRPPPTCRASIRPFVPPKEKSQTLLSPHCPACPRPPVRALTSASGSTPLLFFPPARTHQSKGHNASEGKYCNNLKGKLDILRLCVPCLCAASCNCYGSFQKVSSWC